MNKVRLSLEKHKSVARKEIDNKVCQIRSHHITTGWGQDLVYLEKFEEAVDYEAAGCPNDLSTYPYIRAETEALELPPKEIAHNIIKAKRHWVSVSSAMEKIRVQAKYHINQAETKDDVSTILTETIDQLKSFFPSS